MNQSPNIAERTFVTLARKYHADMLALIGARPPSSLDDLSYACLLLCHEAGIQPTESVKEMILKCYAAAETWMDKLPWELMAEIIAPKPGRRAFSDLVANLSHHNSSIRAYIMDMAWFVRTRLPLEESADALLKNFADTLGYLGEAIGLCVALFPSMNDFWAYADAYDPPSRFEGQYKTRLAELKQTNVAQYTVLHIESESQIRKLIMEHAFALRSLEPLYED